MILLVVIYVVFISLGLPDSVLGSAWPAIQSDLGLQVGLGGLIAVVATSMTIISSLATSTLVRKMGVGLLLTLSTGLTVSGLIGFSQADSLLLLIFSAILLGLGAGAIDSALNNYVATHYAAHHMNWLHAFWGVGATLGPIIFAATLSNSGDWHKGYLTIAIIQAGIVLILLLSLSLWSKVKQRHKSESEAQLDIAFRMLLKEPAVLLTFAAFFLYVGIEVGVGLWLATYLVKVQHVAFETAAFWAGIYYAAITVGRVLTGFISFKVTSKHMIRIGLCLSLGGALLLASNYSSVISIIGIVFIGLGLAPVYPGLIHETPERFGTAKSAKVISLQMVGGYLGASLLPPLMGFLSGAVSLMAFAILTPFFLMVLIVCTEYANKLIANRS